MLRGRLSVGEGFSTFGILLSKEYRERWYPGLLMLGARAALFGAAAPAMFPVLAMSGPNTPAPFRVCGGLDSPHGFGSRRFVRDATEAFAEPAQRGVRSRDGDCERRPGSERMLS